MRVLVTGATGFIGRGILESQVRYPDVAWHGISRREPIETADWTEALRGMDAVVHTLGRAHVMRERAANPLEEFRRVNVEATSHLARQAAGAGVRRFVFLSSIKVNGERTAPDHPFVETDPPNPTDPYAVSKKAAEDELRSIAVATGLEVVIIRPVLVYGPGVKGNFLSMLRWVARGIPLPLGAIHNRRSLVSRDNLVDLIHRAVEHPLAANETFLVSDGVDLSTTELIRRIARALGVTPRLLPVPTRMLSGAAGLLGRNDVVDRIAGSLQVDIGRARDLLGWTPPVAIETALAETARWYLDRPRQ